MSHLDTIQLQRLKLVYSKLLKVWNKVSSHDAQAIKLEFQAAIDKLSNEILARQGKI